MHADPAVTAAATERLVDLALIWESPGGLRPLSGVCRGAPRRRGGRRERVAADVGRPGHPREVAAHLDAISPRARALLEHVLAHGGEGMTGNARRTVSPADAATPVEELIAHRLLIPRDGGLVVLPGEVGIALRGGHTTTTPRDEVPELAATERDAALVDRTAGGAAFDVVRRTELLLDHWGLEPPATLRSGGLAVRDLKSRPPSCRSPSPRPAC